MVNGQAGLRFNPLTGPKVARACAPNESVEAQARIASLRREAVGSMNANCWVHLGTTRSTKNPPNSKFQTWIFASLLLSLLCAAHLESRKPKPPC